ncbi:MAG: hypothetical protein PHV94_05900 [Bacilli bacterium]|jgi:hypothetical protein|nr:hypothetical protein [Bacilli bacterium]
MKRIKKKAQNVTKAQELRNAISAVKRAGSTVLSLAYSTDSM